MDILKNKLTQFSVPENAVIHSVKVNLTLRGVPDVAHIVQYDDSLAYIEVTIYKNNDS